MYEGLAHSISAVNDSELVGFLLGGPYSNPSIFHSSTVSPRALLQMRVTALDGFDLHVFSRSEAWGLAVSWEEEVAVIGGTQEFMSIFVNAVGGIESIRRNFAASSAYLLEIGDHQRQVADRLARLNDQSMRKQPFKE